MSFIAKIESRPGGLGGVWSTSRYLTKTPYRGKKLREQTRWRWALTTLISKAHVFDTPMAAQKQAERIAKKLGITQHVEVWSIDQYRVYGRKVWPIDDIIDAVSALA